MHGLGDNIHQRAIMNKLRPHYDIWLETSWPVIYHDMPDVKLLKKSSGLRTQTKNSDRENHRFSPPIGCYDRNLKIWYRPDDVRRHGGVLSAMMNNCQVSPQEPDYDFPTLKEWRLAAHHIIKAWNTDKPILIYRPLIIRKEWGGCERRNPDIETYYELLKSIRDKFFVVSVADTVDGVEWIVSKDIEADIEFHHGELPIEILSALVEQAELTYNSPGFMSILSKSVGTPNICVFGGYENSKSFSAGSSPYLGIDPINSCQCFSHTHSCDKRIDIKQAKKKVGEFIECHCQL